MQVPAHFEYARAASVDEALALLSRYGPQSRVVAGGHSLIPMMKLRLAQPEALIDINDLTELGGVRVEGGVLRIGALVRHAELLASARAGELFPILHDAERVIADPVVRNRGTIGGSLCQADPSEDLSAVFAALDARAVVRGPHGTRTVPVREFYTGPYETVVEPGELLLEIRVPIRAGGGSAYAKVHRRAGDWAVAAAGAALWLEGAAPGRGSRTSRRREAAREVGAVGQAGAVGSAGAVGQAGAAGEPRTVADVGIGLTAVGAAAFVAAAAEKYLRGKPATEEYFARAGRIAAEHCNPPVDQRGPADYKRHLAGELTIRALRSALARATGRAG